MATCGVYIFFVSSAAHAACRDEQSWKCVNVSVLYNTSNNKHVIKPSGKGFKQIRSLLHCPL